MSLPVVILGAGGHAKVLINCLQLRGQRVLGVTTPDTTQHGTLFCGVPVLGNDNALVAYAPTDVALVNGLGSVQCDGRRAALFAVWKKKGYRFASVVHPSAIIADNVVLGEGVQIMAGVVVQPGCTIAENSIVNTRASIDHDVVVGKHVHIAPGCVLSGGISIGDGSHLGTGCVVIQGITIGKSALVAAGAVVVRSVPTNAHMRGVPAREIPQE